MKKQLAIIIIVSSIIGLGVIGYKVAVRTNQKATTERDNKLPPGAPLKQYSFDKTGIKFSVSADMSVTGDESQDGVFTFTVQRGKYPEKDYYQLYGILQKTPNPTFDTESVKKDLAEGAKDTTVGGVAAVQGKYKGERNNLVTFIFTNKGLFKLTTTPSSTNNEVITNSILDTLTFDLGSKIEPAVRKYVAKTTGVDENLVIIISTVNKDWSDGCLGLGGPAESCIAAITPGYEVIVKINGKEQKYRTNADG